ncbi:MAG: DUF2975 domain-containing protein [Bacteroidia bacterium]
MERNQILKLSVLVFKALRVFCIIALGILAVVAVMWHISPDTLQSVYLDKDTLYYQYSGQSAGTEAEISLNEMGQAAFYFNSLKLAIILLVLLYIFQRALRIIRSMKSLQTFRDNNVRQFQKIGSAFLVLALFNTFYFMEVSGHAVINFMVPFNSLLAALLGFLLAEIFKEGNRLMEENQLTV